MPAGRPEVIDQFTPLDIPRQRKWQLRRMAAGLCSLCGREVLTNATLGERCISKLKAKSSAKHAGQRAGAKFVRAKVAQKKVLTRRILKVRKASN